MAGKGVSMIDPEQFRQRTGVTPPSLFHHPLTVSRSWLVRARAGRMQPVPRSWPKRLAREAWIPMTDAQDLLDALGVWPADSLVEHLTQSVSSDLVTMRGRRSEPTPEVYAYPTADVAFALLVAWRLGVPLPIDDLLRPLKQALARRKWLTAVERHVHAWTTQRERRVAVFEWMPAAEANDLPLAGEWTCWKLHDGRFVFAFRNREGCSCEVVSRPGVYRDLSLSLLLAGAPEDLRGRLGLQEIGQSAPPAAPLARPGEKPMAVLRRLVREVQVSPRNPDQPRQSRD